MRARAAAMVLLAFLLLGVLLAAIPAGARSPGVRVDVSQSVVKVDFSVNQIDAAVITGTVSVDNNEFQSATVDLSVDAGSWTGVDIAPSQKQVAGNDTFSFTATIRPPLDAAEGQYLVKVFARAETLGFPAASAVDTTTLVLVRNRVRLECDQPVLEARPGQALAFPIRVYNDGSTKDTFSSEVEGRPGPLERVRFLLDQSSLEVEPGKFVYMNVQVNVGRNATPGDYAAAFTARSSASGNSTRELALTVRIAAPLPSGQPGSGPNYYLVIGIPLLIALVCLTAFIGGTEVGLLAFLQFILVPLFVRIKKDRVLDHFTRGQIFGFIKANPGTHYISIQEHLELHNGVLAYHLAVLEREEYITSERDGIYKRFYPKHMKIPHKERQLSRVQRDILSALRTHPGTSQNGLARMLGESKQVVGYHIRVLQKAAIVRVERDAQQTRCYIEGEGPPIEVEPKEPEPEEAPEIVRDIRA